MRFSIESPVDPALAFDEIADFGDVQRWDPFVRSSRLIRGAPLEVGAVYVLKSFGGLELRYRVVDVDVPRFVVYQGGTDRVRSTDTIEVSGTDPGSRITVDSVLRFEGRMRLLASLIRALVWLGGRLASVPGMRKRLSELADGSS